MQLRVALLERERERLEDAGLKDWSEAATSHGVLIATKCWQPPEAVRGKDWILPESLQRKGHSADILILASATDFRLLASGTIALKHPFCGCYSSPKKLI